MKYPSWPNLVISSSESLKFDIGVISPKFEQSYKFYSFCLFFGRIQVIRDFPPYGKALCAYRPLNNRHDYDELS